MYTLDDLKQNILFVIFKGEIVSNYYYNLPHFHTRYDLVYYYYAFLPYFHYRYDCHGCEILDSAVSPNAEEQENQEAQEDNEEAQEDNEEAQEDNEEADEDD